MVRLDVDESVVPPDVASTGDIPAANSETIRTQLGEIFAGLRRIVSLELSIWAARAKLAVVRIVTLVAMLCLAVLLTLIGVIFLYAGVYRVLTDVLHVPAHWALLSFAGVHVLVAIVLVMVGVSMFKGDNKKKPGEESS